MSFEGLEKWVLGTIVDLSFGWSSGWSFERFLGSSGISSGQFDLPGLQSRRLAIPSGGLSGFRLNREFPERRDAASLPNIELVRELAGSQNAQKTSLRKSARRRSSVDFGGAAPLRTVQINSVVRRNLRRISASEIPGTLFMLPVLLRYGSVRLR